MLNFLIGSYSDEVHALIYNDDYVALTLHECTYEFWSLVDGKPMRENQHVKDWRLSQASIEKILNENHENKT